MNTIAKKEIKYPPISIECEVLQDFTHKLCELEVQLFQQRAFSWSDSITQYFQSTPVKSAFARLMYSAQSVKSGYTLTQITNKLRISRQAATQMVKECLDAGWIELCDCQKDYSKSNGYVCTEPLRKALYGYADYLHDRLVEAEIFQSEVCLMYLKKRKVN